MKKMYIGIPLKDGCHVDGADEGIKVINENYKLNKILNVAKLDNDLNTIINIDKELARIVEDALINNIFPISIGGDHSLAMGSIAGSSKVNGNLGVIWLDTHPDVNTIDTTVTYHIHGYPLAASMGFGQKELTNLYYNGTKVNYENVVMFGINDIDTPEQELIDKYNIRVYPLTMIREKGLDYCLDDAINYLKAKTNNVHFSFDIDVTNPYDCPGVSVPNNYNDGLKKEEVLKCEKTFLKNLNIVSMDLVEYNPINDKDNKSLNLVLDAIKIVDEIKK